MEKTRVKKGEKYYLINTTLGTLEVDYLRDWRTGEDDAFFKTGNYFHTEEEAEVCARKLRAVMKGADVIEMPSDEEIQKVLAEKIPIHGGRTYGESLNCCWFEEGIHWLRDNKIVK